MTMFYSYWSLVGNVMNERGHQYKAGRISTTELIGSLMLTWFIPQVLEQVIRNGGWGDDDKEVKKNLINTAVATFIYPTQAYVGLREITNFAANRIAGQFSDYKLTPAEGAVEALTVIPDIIDDIAHQQFERSTVKDIFNAAGYWGGLPTKQAWITGEYIYDMMQGNEKTDDVLHVVRGLTMGLPYDEHKRPKPDARTHNHWWRS